MAVNETPPEDDGMADWAEALLEQKGADQTAPDPEQGGVLSGGGSSSFSSSPGDGQINDINMVLDIPVQLSVELGRTKVPIKHILQLGQGSVVELDALAGELKRKRCSVRRLLRARQARRVRRLLRARRSHRVRPWCPSHP